MLYTASLGAAAAGGGRKITIIASDRRWNPLKVSRDSAAVGPILCVLIPAAR